MPNNNLVLAVSSSGKSITVKDCNEFLKKKDKKQLANFIYERLYGRYLKPFDYPAKDYILGYKNGFSLMASCCLLIETYVSFKEKGFRNTSGQSGKTFGCFFTTESRFQALATGGRKLDGTIASKKDGGLPNDFYENVRCGILHNAETKSGWTITRNQSAAYFDPATKKINATKFANRLKFVLSDYKNKLLRADFDNDEIWLSFKNRLDDLINKS
ncbi:MAG: hypothetical protein KA821_10390 [Chitinophagaceae bacterium]|nr:hypothetical protein [Chitinophagaceae bacterium]